MKRSPSPIASLLPVNGDGHHFVIYADCCSGIPGTRHEQNFAAVNAVLQRLVPQPEFILFPGDEIRGLVSDPDVLREQWRHWFEVEMAWLDRAAIPLYHTTANHTVYDPTSEAVFREVMAHLPRNGPPGQEGLSYVVRRGDLVMVFVNTLWSALGGEGRVETAWLDDTLTAHADARHKLVIGHHPVFPTNGFTGAWQRQVAADDGQRLWSILARYGVSAYLCSHMLAFDVQVHQGVLQIMTAGAGTEPGMPETEYRHLVQMAIDDAGLRYQVLDSDGTVRERLSWPVVLPDSATWSVWEPSGKTVESSDTFVVWRFSGQLATDQRGDPQTLLSGWHDDAGIFAVWIGLRGPEQRLALLISPAPGRSPHLWLGPPLTPRALERNDPTRPDASSFDVQIGVHMGMGPGGILWRWDDASPWTSMESASSWGAERITWPTTWSDGCERGVPGNQPFRGSWLVVRGVISSKL